MRESLRCSIYTLVACMTVGVATIGAAPVNLLQNGNAEQGELGKSAPFWSPAGYDGMNYPNQFPFEVADGGRGGSRMIRIQKPGGYEWVYIQQFVPMALDSASRCTFSVWLKSDKPMPASVDLVIIPTIPGGVPVTIGTARERVDVGTDWKQYTASVLVPDSRDQDNKPWHIEMRAIIQLYSPGPLMVDDASFVREPQNAIEKAESEAITRVSKNSGLPSPVGTYGGIVARPDGKLLAFGDDFAMSSSSDGIVWTGREKLAISDSTDHISGAAQLKDGTIAVWTESWGSPLYMWTSADGGKTWSKRREVSSKGAPLAGNVLFEAKDGSLLLPLREGHSVHGGLWQNVGAFGTVRGKRVMTESHAHALEMDITFVAYKQAGSAQWQRSRGDIIIWKDDGFGGMWPCDEPNIAQLKDGRLIMFVRTTLGRLYQTFGSDGGATWGYPVPTSLPSSYSPCSLKTIPANDYTTKLGCAGDLICIWNNVSREEVRRGFRRGRLSSAISKDDGKTWIHVRTIDAVGIPPLNKVAPLSPPAMTRADKNLGELPMPFGNAHYADMTFWGDKVIVKYAKSAIRPQVDMGARLKILPLAWFYGK